MRYMMKPSWFLSYRSGIGEIFTGVEALEITFAQAGAEVDALLPRSRYLWGFSASSAARGEDGGLYANIRKQYRIGELDGSLTSRLTRIIELFERAGFTLDIKSNIIEWQWVHHAIDAGLIGTAPQPELGR
jgi:ketopantoate reductase